MVNKIMLVSLILLLASAIETPASADTDISACGQLTTDGETYNLIQDISANMGNSHFNSCLVIKSNNITLNGNGHWVNVTNKGSSILLNKSDSINGIKLKDIKVNGDGTQLGIIRVGRYAFNNNSNDSTFTNMTVQNADTGIRVGSSDNTTIRNITFANNPSQSLQVVGTISNSSITELTDSGSYLTINSATNIYLENLTSILLYFVSTASNVTIINLYQPPGSYSQILFTGHLANSSITNTTTNTNIASEGIYITTASDVILRNITANNNEYDGLMIRGDGANTYNNVSVIDGTFNGNGAAGWDADYQDGVYIERTSNLTLFNISVDTAFHEGITFYLNKNVTATNITVRNTGNCGLQVGGDNLTISNYTSQNNLYGFCSGGVSSVAENGDSSSNTGNDYIIPASGYTSFRSINLTHTYRKIYFTDASSNFSVRNDNILLDTNVSVGGNTFNRQVFSWTKDNVTYNDSNPTGSITAYYLFNNLYYNQDYIVSYNGTQLYNLTTDGSGNLPKFSIALSAGENQMILEPQFASVTIACPIGWCYIGSNYSAIKNLSELDTIFSTDTIQGKYNATSQKYESHRTGYSFNQNITVTRKEGYYYYFSSPQEITTTPESTPSITLKSGWNLVANYGISARTLADLKTSIGAPATQAKYYDKTLKTWVSSDSQSVPAMEAFFVYVTSQTDWSN